LCLSNRYPKLGLDDEGLNLYYEHSSSIVKR